MNSSLQQETKKLFKYFLLGYFIVTSVVVVSILLYYHWDKRKLALAYGQSAKYSLLIRDLRQATHILSPSLNSNQFTQVRILDDQKKLITSLARPQDTFLNSLFWITLTESFYLENSNSLPVSQAAPLVTMELQYSLAEPLLFSMLIILILLVVMIYFFKVSRRKLWQNYQILLQQKQNEMLLAVSAQVAHDIRSPLAALNMVMGATKELPEDKRILIRNAVHRINDIANQLLEKGKQAKTTISPLHTADKSTDAGLSEMPAMEVQLLAPLMDAVVSEKRVQFREKQNVQIEVILDQAYGLFAMIQPLELTRVLSNLINNSIEALHRDQGLVTVQLYAQQEKVLIKVQDNGQGIPEHILSQLGQKGFSHGKDNTSANSSGSGLGLYHAKQALLQMHGALQIESMPGQGTTIILSLPKATAPGWFVEEIQLEPLSSGSYLVVSVDDDLSIHGIWQGRLTSKSNPTKQIQHLTFTSGSEFKSWVESEKPKADFNPILFLVDYEFLNQTQNGLNLIEDLGIASQAILVTSRFEEPSVRRRCEKLGVKLIPKNMASFVPIQIMTAQLFFDAVLVDDDPLVEMIWQMAAEQQNKKMIYFKSADDFLKMSSEIDKRSNIYVDANLGLDRQGQPIRGEEVCLKLHHLGFVNLYLATGYEAESFTHVPYIKGIIGKDPVFKS
ncbi:MAG: sensor histidine kinase [Pseudobdellovibrionaceae bacterium]